MKNTVKCYRCGKEQALDFKHLSRVITCPHCQGKMSLDEMSRKKLKFFRYLVIFMFIGLLSLAVNQIQKNQYTAVLIVVAFSLPFAFISDTLCLWLTWKVFGIEYEEYVPKKKSRKKK